MAAAQNTLQTLSALRAAHVEAVSKWVTNIGALKAANDLRKKVYSC
jgi:hypothetical protein